MRRNIILCLLIISSHFLASTSYAREPKNLDSIKASLIKYHDSGEYQKDQAKVINEAIQYLKIRLEKSKHSHHHKKFAIVLDIDETSLSNYPNMVAMHFGGTFQAMKIAEDQATDPVIAPTLALFHYAKANQVAVFFITGRTESSRAATEKNLNAVGYKNWDGLTFKADDYQNKSIAPYKINARIALEKAGYEIVLNIGDQQSDLSGHHADKIFKLPNPYYFIP